MSTPLHKLSGPELLALGQQITRDLAFKEQLSTLPGNPEVCEFCGRTLERGEGVHWPGHPAAEADGYVYRRVPCMQEECVAKRAEVLARYQRGKERLKEEQQRQKLQRAGIAAANMAGLTFEGYDTEWPSEERLRVPLRDMLHKVQAWAQGPQGLAVLSGPVGVGKTRLAVASLRHFLKHSEQSGFFLACSEARAAMTSLWSAKRGTSAMYRGMPMTETDFNERTQCAGLLVIDDLDKVKPTDNWLKWVLSVVNYRFDHQLPGLLTLNTSVSQLLAFFRDQGADPTTAQALFSRLQGMWLKSGVALDLPQDRRLDYRAHSARITGGG